MTTSWNTALTQIQTTNLDAGITSIRRMFGKDATAAVEDEFQWTSNIALLGPVTMLKGDVLGPIQLALTLNRYTLLGTRAKSYHVHSKADGLRSTSSGKTAVLLSPGERVVVDIDPRLSSQNLTIDPEFLAAQFAALTGETVADIRFERGVDLQSPTGALINQLYLYVDRYLDNGGTSLPPALVSSLCETLSRALLVGLTHDHSYLLDAPVPPSSRTIVRMVEEYLDAHAGGPIVASDLAQLTGVPIKSIDAAFQQHRQTTSLAFLRQRRLERARRSLLEDQSIPITRVAQLAGYLRLETFQDAYFKTFRETPLETRHRGFIRPASTVPLFPPESLPTPQGRLSLLTNREKLICERIVQGRLNKQIADELAIAERTVKQQRSLALKKLGVTSTVELVKLWERLAK